MRNVLRNRKMRGHRSDIYLFWTMSEPKHVPRLSPNPSSITTLRWQYEKIKERIDTLDNDLRSSNEVLLAILNHGTTAVPKSFLQLLIDIRNQADYVEEDDTLLCVWNGQIILESFEWRALRGILY